MLYKLSVEPAHSFSGRVITPSSPETSVLVVIVINPLFVPDPV